MAGQQLPTRGQVWTLCRACIGRGLALAVGLLLATCGGPADEPIPIPRGPGSFLLLTLDTTRADALDPYGADGVTPNLGRLAAEGIVFEHAYAVTPLTTPSHASILTGLYPPQHGVRTNGQHRLGDEVTTLAEHLAPRGYRTAAFVSAAVLERRYGLDQGFEVYDDDLAGGRDEARMVAERIATPTVDAALGWLDGLGADEPFFLWVHLFDPHASYTPPEPYRSRFVDQPYLGEVAWMDAEIGRLLDHPRLAGGRRAAVMAIGDHGESLGEHGEATHGLLAYDGTLRVPWILRLPDGPRGRRFEPAVSQVDLVPTVLDLLTIDRADAAGPGRSLLSALAAGDWEERELYAESLAPRLLYGWAELRVARRGAWKSIDAPTPELYDTRRDPLEGTNRASERAPLLAELLASLDLYEDETAAEGADLELDPATRAKLESLGYTATLGARSGDGEGPDPKEMIEIHHLVQQAQGLMAEGRVETAEGLWRDILRQDPGNHQALLDLSRLRYERGDLEGAVAVLERGLATYPGDAAFALSLEELETRRGAPEARPAQAEDTAARNAEAEALARQGRFDEARRIWQEMVETTPRDPVAYGNLAALALERGDWEAARRWAERAVELDPTAAPSWNSLAFALDELGQTAAAAAAYGRALEADPSYLGARLNLGLLYKKAQDWPRAAATFEEVLERAPGHWQAHFELALLYAGPLGDPARSRPHLVAALEAAPDHPKAPALRQLLARIDGLIAGG